MSKAFGQISAESTQIEEKVRMSYEARKAKQFETRKKKNFFQRCLVIKQLGKIDFMCFNVMCTWPAGVENKCFVVVIYAFI